VATSDNEHIPINRKRHRVPATVQEEEDAAPAQTPRSRQRSQSSASPEDTTYFGPQNQTEQDAAPTSPSNNAGEAQALVRAAKQRRRAERADFQQRVQSATDLMARRPLEQLEREMAASLQQTQAPTDMSTIFFLGLSRPPPIPRGVISTKWIELRIAATTATSGTHPCARAKYISILCRTSTGQRTTPQRIAPPLDILTFWTARYSRRYGKCDDRTWTIRTLTLKNSRHFMRYMRAQHATLPGCSAYRGNTTENRFRRPPRRQAARLTNETT